VREAVPDSRGVRVGGVDNFERKDGWTVRKLISMGILAAFLAAVSIPSIGCSSSSKSKKETSNPSGTTTKETKEKK
jgi:hypothetical protein